MKRFLSNIIAIFFLLLLSFQAKANFLIIPMDESQKNHLKSYGVAYKALSKEYEVDWMLNYQGGAFAMSYSKEIETICRLKGVSYYIVTPSQYSQVLEEISAPSVNQDVVKLQKVPKIAVYSPKNKLPWDDAVTLVLTYAEIPYDIVYDQEVMNDVLPLYDWLHLHHEDFTGQYGKFWASYRNKKWYQDDVALQEQTARARIIRK